MLRKNAGGYLKQLSLRSTRQMVSSDIAQIQFGGLEELVLHNCDVTDEVLLSISADLSVAEITERVGRAGRESSRSLESLTLSFSEITDIGLGVLESLTSVDLTSCLNTSDEGVSLLASRCPSMKRINLRSCRQLTDHAIMAIAMNCAFLESCDVTDLTNITPLSLGSLAAHCPALTALNARNCQGLVTNTSCNALREFRSLTYLNISFCTGVGDEGFVKALGRESKLAYLNLRGLDLLTDASVTALARACPLLQGLTLRGCQGISDVSLAALAGLELQRGFGVNLHAADATDAQVKQAGWPPLLLLRKLDVSWSSDVGDVGVRLLAQCCPSLSTVDVRRTRVTAVGKQALLQANNKLNICT